MSRYELSNSIYSATPHFLVPYSQWLANQIANRTDAVVFNRDGKQFKKSPLTKQDLMAHSRGDCGLAFYAISPANESKWVAVDLDNHSGDTETAKANQSYALALHEELSGLGFHPIVEGSNGDGGFHIWLLFNRPVATPVAYSFAAWIVEELCDYRSCLLEERPETNPKHPTLTETRLYGNAVRAPGRHPKRKCWSQVWNGSNALNWPEAVDFLLSHAGDDPALIPPEARDYVPEKNKNWWQSPTLAEPDDPNFPLSWPDIIEPHGWQLNHTAGDVGYWRRPSKSQEPKGVSANTNYGDKGKLYIWSESADIAPLKHRRFYSRIEAYAALNHDGDIEAAQEYTFTLLQETQ